METQEDEKCMLSWKTYVFKVTNTMKMNLQLDNLTPFTKNVRLSSFTDQLCSDQRLLMTQKK